MRRRVLLALPAIALILLTFYTFSLRRASQILSPPTIQVDPDEELPDIQRRIRHPLSSFIPLPTGLPVNIPKIQHGLKLEAPLDRKVRENRLEAVKDAFIYSWDGYMQNAWLEDEVIPTSGGSRTTLFGGWGATLVDSLDTLWIMGLEEDFEIAVDAAASINFNRTEQQSLNVFETTIRFLGGFLGAYDVSEGKYPVLLQKALEVGELLYLAFDTPNRMPVTRWKHDDEDQEALDNTLLAEIGSLSLEFTRLSQLSGDPKFYDAIQRITNHLDEQQMQTKLPGMWPVSVNAKILTFTEGNWFTLGAMADSVYEYLTKEYLLLGGLSDQYRKLYQNAMVPVKEHLLFRPMTPQNDKILFSGNVQADSSTEIRLDPQGQHLGCFAGGMIGLGAKVFREPDDLVTARQLTDGCIWAYDNMATGIMPETFHLIPCPRNNTDIVDCRWDVRQWSTELVARNSADDSDASTTSNLNMEERARRKSQQLRIPCPFTAIGDKRYLLRPEALESIFVLYRITGDESLREDAWTMFEAITAQTRGDVAFSAIDDVTWKNPPKSDRMESFWMAETLKYCYLLYSKPTVISLDEYVFNTEGHAFKRPNPERRE